MDFLLALCYFALQLALVFGFVFLFGFAGRELNRRFYLNMGNAGKYICYITGALAVPIHESSHALLALAFRHKIKEFQPFKIDEKNRTLGYVIHGYNKKSLYQNIGNFFIGIAPMLIMSLLIFFLAIFLAPGLLNASLDSFSALRNSAGTSQTLDSFRRLWAVFADSFKDWKFYVFVLLSMVLALHMTLSKADLRGSSSGVVFLLFIMVVVNLAIYITDGVAGSRAFSMSVARFVFPIILMMMIANVFLLIALGISAIVKAASVARSRNRGRRRV